MTRFRMALAVLATAAGLLIPAGAASAATAAPAHGGPPGPVAASTPAWSAARPSAPATVRLRLAADAGSADAAKQAECPASADSALTAVYVDHVLASVSGPFQGGANCNKNMNLLRINVDLTKNGVTVGTGRNKCTRPFCRNVGVSETYSCDAGTACAGTYQVDLDSRAVLNSGSWKPMKGCVVHGKEQICHLKSNTAVIPPGD
jgi:hypothetical protein